MRTAALVLAIFCAVPFETLSAPASAAQIEHPDRGSDMRKILLDAARPKFEAETNGPVEFVVGALNVMGSWAFADVTLQRPGGGAIDWSATTYAEDAKEGMFDPAHSFVLLGRIDGVWHIIQHATGPTDAVWVGWQTDHNLPAALFER